MHVLITGAGGTVGRFLAHRMLTEGHEVTSLGRAPVEDTPLAFSSYDLADPAPDLPMADVLIHCALHHAPGKFRGGEGSDPDRFWRLNVDGTKALFAVAKATGCRHAVFVSSRAVYGDHRGGETLREADEPAPDTLYGEAKLAGEHQLSDLCDDAFCGIVLRPTGVYGVAPGLREHKWSGLFDSFLSGNRIEPRCGTEVHGDDLASAVSLLLKQGNTGKRFDVFNVSDLMLDRSDLLGMLASPRAVGIEVPEKSSRIPGEMDTARLRALGWKPGGVQRLLDFLNTCSPV